MSIEAKIKSGVMDIVTLLVNRDYSKLVELNKLSVLEAEEVKSIYQYSEFWDHEGVVTLPPIEALDQIDIIEISKPKKAFREFHVEFDLWVEGEKSDLTLICDAESDEQGNVNVYLYDVHVL